MFMKYIVYINQLPKQEIIQHFAKIFLVILILMGIESILQIIK